MRKYHLLTVATIRNETPDSVRVTLTVPEDLRQQFDFLPGQHLPLQILLGDEPVRRTYSICSVPADAPLEIGIRVQPGGRFSNYVQDQLQVGDQLQVMPPFGRFHVDIDPRAKRTVLAFAAGSGITPVLSIMRAVLEGEPASRVMLFYGNRRQQTSMFIEDLCGLKNRFPERLQLHFLFSQEAQEFDVFSGRLDREKVSELYRSFCSDVAPDDAFICGPDTMLDEVKAALIDAGMDEKKIHSERYGAPRKRSTSVPAPRAIEGKIATVDVIMDGHRKSFVMSAGSGNIVDAAAEHGIQLPYSCKGGVCATCRTYLREGEVRMASNYGLEPWEVEEGFVLACQSMPLSEKITIDYDKT